VALGCSGQGWEEGQGLGKNKQGISTHVRVVKFDSSGQGGPQSASSAQLAEDASSWEVARGRSTAVAARAAAEPRWPPCGPPDKCRHRHCRGAQGGL